MSLTRYRIDEAVGASTVTDDMMVLTSIYGIVVGIILVILARRFRQQWMVFWGSGLSIISVVYLLAEGLNWF
ncbi:MAG: hypothetical protein ACO3RT_05205 [Arenicellales bacterium]|jgi:hypothetical protein|nr:hypothetical protein [Gammaproteobacteria bacterium]NDA14164.1 hypothetical protein [Gammaproteobacteria bacterium]NDG44549.1 hypothetical protein [Gammaproteobacteria bacterium]